jgi:hypothetical protein
MTGVSPPPDPAGIPIQGQCIVFRVAGDEHLATILGGRQIDARLFRLGEDLQIGVGADEIPVEAA